MYVPSVCCALDVDGNVTRTMKELRSRCTASLSDDGRTGDREPLHVPYPVSRGSLCRQAREEELAGKLRDMEVLRQGGALPPGGSQLQAELQQAQARLQEHGQYIDGKLLALSKYCARLDAALAWAADLAQRRAAGAPAADIAAALAERSHEVREVLENYTNLERQCGAARQTVAPDVREPALRLRELWQTLRAPPTTAPPTTAPPAAAPLAASPPERRSSADSVHSGECRAPAVDGIHLHCGTRPVLLSLEQTQRYMQHWPQQSVQHATVARALLSVNTYDISFGGGARLTEASLQQTTFTAVAMSRVYMNGVVTCFRNMYYSAARPVFGR
ncbi:hypothetical protein SFRURICE_010649 [Spodoptera frugiperda]|nr:hypothetical protein SFRURICE_010649 [Spodoptera frugiperda]